MNPDDFVVDMDINSMYASIVTAPMATGIPYMRVLKNRYTNKNGTYYKWKIPTPNHFEDEEDLFRI